MIQCSTVA
ncbi:hypothetical protein [Leishmaniavirus sani]|uniref:Uncharacterized protein n=1 Tax=Leishmania aethiopica RNA virus TaxID=1497019 RepID=A0A024B487_9VIRU|nr:hypothetical protein [Leishmania aethiopica RNA virus]AHZ10898.1 hypothetical protein [Leishmania aethiopica RNA virus]